MEKMKWLELSTIDLEGGPGGVEVHVRATRHYFQKMGWEVKFSKDLIPLNEFQVIHTHGSALKLSWLPSLYRHPNWIHTLHGTSIGRLIACQEWFWAGGYFAFFKECLASILCQRVFTVHSRLLVIYFLKLFGKKVHVCSNGWDYGLVETQKPKSIPLKIKKPSVLFVGRGDDPVKNTIWLFDQLIKAGNYHLVAAPGSGFPEHELILKTGALSQIEINSVLDSCQALCLTSHYEGLPLVVLEALGNGHAVIATEVGGLKDLKNLQGLLLFKPESSDGFLSCLNDKKFFSQDKKARANHNRKNLKTWKDVSEIYLRGINT